MNQDIAVQTLLSIGVDPDRFDDSARQEFLERCKSGPTRDVLAFLTCGMPASGPQFQTPPIARAAEGGGLERILLLHSHGADLDERDASGDTALHTAANWNRGRLVVQLMQAGASADVVNNKRWTPLTYALAEENSDVVDVLLAHGADPNFSPVDGGPLVFALDKPYLLERMLEAGANASAAYKDGNTLLLVATSRDHAETVRLLLDAGAEDPPNPHGWTARMVADALGLTTIIREMDQRGVPSSDTSFYTLHVAAKAGKLDRLKELVEAGQPLDARDWLGKTPLLAAAQGNQHNAVRFLVERGADAKASAEGANAVTYAARDGELELLNILLEAGAPANETEGNSLALILAATTSSDVVERLLKAGAAVDSTDSYDQTALYCAAAANRLDIAQLLLAAGASSTSGDSTGGHLPLQIATLEGHVEMVRLLVESGADLDTREPVLGNTALLTACGGYENTDPAFAEIVRILLDAGADYTVTPKFGQSTPRLEAESTKNQPCLDAMMAFLTDPAREPDPEVIAALLAAGELDRVRAIIEDGLDPTVLTAGPQPPIFAALSLADPTLANLMLDHGADPHARFLGQTTLDVVKPAATA